MKTIFVTGGAGFIGSALIRAALGINNFQIVNIDKLTYSGNLSSIPNELQHENYFFEKVDICERQALKKLFTKYKPNGLIHLAAESHVDRSIDDPLSFIQTNIIGTYNLLEESREYLNSIDKSHKKNYRFHHISTDEVFGDLKINDPSFTESSRYIPSSPYSASKASSDHLVRSWGKTYEMPILVTNCSNNYGPYHYPEKLIPHVILSALNGKEIPVYGDGKQIRDWLYVEDHAKALLHVYLNGIPGETYNIGGNCEKKNIDVINEICEIMDELIDKKPKKIDSFKELIKFVQDRPGHDKRYSVDNSKILNELGWKPEETFKTGIIKTVNWYLDNRSWWQEIINKNYNFERLGKIDE